MKTKLIKKFDKPPPKAFNNKSKSKNKKYTIVMTHPHIQRSTNKIDYLKRIYYVVNNGDGYAREAESARARRAH